MRIYVTIGTVFIGLLISFFSGCFTTSTLSIINASGRDARITLYTNDKFQNEKGLFEKIGDRKYITPILKHNDRIEFENRVYMDVFDDIPFDSIQIMGQDGSAHTLTREQIYPGSMDTDVFGLIANPYCILAR